MSCAAGALSRNTFFPVRRTRLQHPFTLFCRRRLCRQPTKGILGILPQYFSCHVAKVRPLYICFPARHHVTILRLYSVFAGVPTHPVRSIDFFFRVHQSFSASVCNRGYKQCHRHVWQNLTSSYIHTLKVSFRIPDHDNCTSAIAREKDILWNYT